MKKFAFSTLIFLVVVVGLIVYIFFKPKPHEAVFKFYKNGSNYELALLLTPAHVYLTEYNRELVLRKEGQEIARTKMRMDTGGYSTTMLFTDNNGDLLVTGSFDFYKVTSEGIEIPNNQDISSAKYEGVFSRSKEYGWQFADASKQPEDTIGAQALKKACIEQNNKQACSFTLNNPAPGRITMEEKTQMYSHGCELGDLDSCELTGDKARYANELKNQCKSKSQDISDWQKDEACQTLNKKFPDNI